MAPRRQAWPGCVLALVAAQLGPASAAYIQGELPHQTDFAWFAGKFVYDYSKTLEDMVGGINLEMTREGGSLAAAEPKQGKLYFVIFDDERGHWKRARKRWDSSTCQEKLADASSTHTVSFLANQNKMEYMIHIREHIRPRMWYFTFVACGLEPGLDISYKIHATNSQWGWQEEFSLDHMEMIKVFFLSIVAFVLATLGTVWISRWREGSDNLREHPYTQLLLLSCMASLASCTFYFAHYLLFAHDGFGSSRLRLLASLASIVANCTIYLIAILASIGWAITRGSLPRRQIFLGLIFLMGGIHAVCELRSELLIDMSAKLYAYATPEGMINMMMKIFMFCWFAYQCMSSYESVQNEKLRKFYKYLGISVSIWAVNVPVTVILANSLAPYFRFKLVTAIDLVARFTGQVLLTQLFCGPLSPINSVNTFRSRADPYIDLGSGFRDLGDGHDNL